MAASANNVSDLVEVAQKGFSFLLYAIGLFDICYFVSNLMGILPLISKQEKDNGLNTNIEIDTVVEVKNDEEQQDEIKAQC